jgi:hypothetical protein
MEFQSNPKRVTIRTVEGQGLSGKINLGLNERLSDVFTREDTPFIILYDVTFDGGKGGRGKVLFVNKKFIILYDVTFDGGKGGRGKVLFVNKKHIVWAEPEEQPG